MTVQRLIRFSGVLLVLGALSMALPGCGGGTQETGPDGTVEPVPPANPAPGDLEPETGLQ